MHDLTERIDLAISLGVLTDRGADQLRYQVGIEAGYLLWSNLWVSAGCNLFGFRDDDLHEWGYTNAGAYARFRFKFAEDWFGWLE